MVPPHLTALAGRGRRAPKRKAVVSGGGKGKMKKVSNPSLDVTAVKVDPNSGKIVPAPSGDGGGAGEKGGSSSSAAAGGGVEVPGNGGGSGAKAVTTPADDGAPPPNVDDVASRFGPAAAAALASVGGTSAPASS